MLIPGAHGYELLLIQINEVTGSNHAKNTHREQFNWSL